MKQSVFIFYFSPSPVIDCCGQAVFDFYAEDAMFKSGSDQKLNISQQFMQ